MEDLKVIFTGGVAFAAFAIMGWIGVLLIVGLIRLLVLGLSGLFKLNNRLTRENPYIAAHKRMLTEERQYNEYVRVARKDGYEIASDEDEDEEEETFKKKRKKKKG